MAKMIVSFQIEVPKSKYCFEKNPVFEICKYYNTESSISKCNLGFHDLTETSRGVIKPKKCLNLSIIYKNNNIKEINDVEYLAIKDQHIILYKFIQMYYTNPELSWAETMQEAAIQLSENLKLKEKMIKDFLNKSLDPVKIKPIKPSNHLKINIKLKE